MLIKTQLWILVKLCYQVRINIIATAFSPFDDTVLATSSEDATVKLWRLPAGYSQFLEHRNLNFSRG